MAAAKSESKASADEAARLKQLLDESREREAKQAAEIARLHNLMNNQVIPMNVESVETNEVQILPAPVPAASAVDEATPGPSFAGTDRRRPYAGLPNPSLFLATDDGVVADDPAEADTEPLSDVDEIDYDNLDEGINLTQESLGQIVGELVNGQIVFNNLMFE